MGQTAEARLIYGVDLGACDNHEHELPDWLRKFSNEEEGPHYGEFAVMEQYEVETFVYGHHEVPRFAFGVQVAWAMDWGSEHVDVAEMNKLIEASKERLNTLLAEMDAPSDTKIGIFLLAEYG